MRSYLSNTAFLTYLPPRKYLSDPTEDVRIAAENQLAEFLREIREVTVVRKHREEQQRLRDMESEEHNRVDVERVKERPSDIAALSDTDRVSFLNGDSSLAPPLDVEKQNVDAESDVNERDIGGVSRCCLPARTYFLQTGFRGKVFESTMRQSSRS